MATRGLIVADTSVWIDLLKDTQTPQAATLEIAINSDRVLLPDLIFVEILKGLRSDKQAREIEKMLEPFDIVIIGGRELAATAARNFRLLRKSGVTLRGTIDLLIGTWCIENEVPLLHKDRDFEAMEKHLGLICVRTDRPH
jgi:predicted nucleic acid-binding protein